MILNPTDYHTFESFEIRWFQRGVLANRWIDAHRSLGYGGSFEESRTDFYLRFVANEDIGVKLRDDKLEVKQRITSSHVHCLPPNSPPIPERWLKYSFDRSVVPPLSFSPGAWRSVGKKRRLVTLAPQHNGNYNLLPLSDRAGIQIELTELTDTDNKPWWTLGFECGTCLAFTALYFLDQVRFFLRFFPLSELKGSMISAYPGWLCATDTFEGGENSERNMLHQETAAR